MTYDEERILDSLVQKTDALGRLQNGGIVKMGLEGFQVKGGYTRTTIPKPGYSVDESTLGEGMDAHEKFGSQQPRQKRRTTYERDLEALYFALLDQETELDSREPVNEDELTFSELQNYLTLRESTELQVAVDPDSFERIYV